MFKKLWQNKIKGPIVKLIQKGVDPKKLAAAFSLGILLGSIPIPGISTWLCLGLSIPLKINKAGILIGNYIATPIQAITIIPLVIAGGYLFDLPPISEEIKSSFNGDLGEILLTLQHFSLYFVGGVLIWLAISIPTGAIMYAGFRKLFSSKIFRKSSKN